MPYDLILIHQTNPYAKFEPKIRLNRAFKTAQMSAQMGAQLAN